MFFSFYLILVKKTIYQAVFVVNKKEEEVFCSFPNKISLRQETLKKVIMFLSRSFSCCDLHGYIRKILLLFGK
jgi:hypothetical protein